MNATVEIAARPEAVWDYTQDYARRTQWDASVLKARVEIDAPERLVWIRGVGLECRFRRGVRRLGRWGRFRSGGSDGER